MQRLRRTRSLAVIACFVSGTVVLPLFASAQTSEIPGLDVAATLPETIHQAETFAVTFELTNTGDSSFEDVVVTPVDACGPSSNEGLVEFEEIQGNSDDLLDPAEVWSYLAPKCIDWAVPLASVDVSVFDGVETHSSSISFEYSPVLPLEVGVLGEVTADECLVRAFEIPLRVTTGTPSSVPEAFLEYAIPQEGGGHQVVDRAEFAEIQHISGNRDAIYDPGEEVLARFFFGTLTDCPQVPEPPLVLFLSMEGTSVESGAPWCFGTDSCPYPKVEVGTIIELTSHSEDTTPTTEPTLPFTGSGVEGAVLLAGAMLAAGALLLAMSLVSRSSSEWASRARSTIIR